MIHDSLRMSWVTLTKRHWVILGPKLEKPIEDTVYVIDDRL